MSDETGDKPLYTALLADDVPELRRLLRHVLEWSDRFAVVAEAEDGAKAIELAGRHKPDLVLLDISMPVMDGIEALPRILAAAPATKVVILSGFEAERLADRAAAEGACAYLEKGIPPALLVKQLLGVLEDHTEDVELPRPTPQAGPSAPVLDVSPEEMMSLVAHEVRNPLAVIQGFGTELQTRWDVMPDQQRRDAVRRMTERARYLSTLVNNLMFLRKLESSGELSSQNAGAHDVKGFLDALGDELRELARGHRLEVEVPDDLPPAHLDLVHLRQVLTNLLVNAARFSPTDQPIRIEAAQDGRSVVIRVVDAGPGIPPAMRENVFGKFQRLSQSGSGIGLGLFISRALMSAMGGELWIEDSEKGADLRLRLRLAP